MTLQTILMMSCMLLFFWGGFIWLLFIAIHKDDKKIKNLED